MKNMEMTMSALSYSIFTPGVATLKSVESVHIYTGATEKDWTQNAHRWSEHMLSLKTLHLGRGATTPDAQAGAPGLPMDCCHGGQDSWARCS